MKWTRFKDRLPDKEKVWVSDYKEIWFLHDASSYEINSDFVWAPAEMPPMPIKEKHFCFSSDLEQICYEGDKPEDKLYLKTYSKIGIETYIEIKACPFCGFTLGDK